MAKFSYGLKSGKSGTTDAQTGLGTALVDIGPVLKDTIELNESDPNPTQIFSQQNTNSPTVILPGGTVETIAFSVMDTSAASMARWCGGKVTTVNGRAKWGKPLLPVNLEGSFEFLTDDGALIEVPRAHFFGKKVFKMADNAIWVIEVTVTPLASNVANVDAVMISDPEAEA